jgi:hypothetical protein
VIEALEITNNKNNKVGLFLLAPLSKNSETKILLKELNSSFEFKKTSTFIVEFNSIKILK